MSLLMRLAVVEDAKAISKLLISSWRFAYKDIMPDKLLAELSINKWQKGWQEHLESTHTEVYVLLEKYEIIGVVELCSLKEKTNKYLNYLEIPVIYLLPEKIGLGYGKRMMNTVLSLIENRKADGVALWVLEDNQRAKSFYNKFGFYFSGDTKIFPAGDLREVLYIRKLK